MTDTASPPEIKGFFEEAELLAAELRELNVKFAAIRDRALKKKIDWAQLKALAVASDLDRHDEKNKGRVAKILNKHTYGSWYAEILHLDDPAKMNNPRVGCSSTLTGEGRHAGRETGLSRVGPPATTAGAGGDGSVVAISNSSDALPVLGSSSSQAATDSRAAPGGSMHSPSGAPDSKALPNFVPSGSAAVEVAVPASSTAPLSRMPVPNAGIAAEGNLPTTTSPSSAATNSRGARPTEACPIATSSMQESIPRDTKSEPAPFSASALGQREPVSDPGLRAGSLTIFNDDEWLPTFLRRC